MTSAFLRQQGLVSCLVLASVSDNRAWSHDKYFSSISDKKAWSHDLYFPCQQGPVSSIVQKEESIKLKRIRNAGPPFGAALRFASMCQAYYNSIKQESLINQKRRSRAPRRKTIIYLTPGREYHVENKSENAG